MSPRGLMAPILLAVILGAVLLPLARDGRPAIRVASAGDLAALFARHGYGAADDAPMPAAVPRLLVASVPRDLAALDRPEARKALFLRLVLPLVLTVNEEIAADRAQLLALAVRLDAGEVPTAEARDWLATLARHYRVSESAAMTGTVDALLTRVDAVPPSLALAQAALESGWGTSRLALAGNALFGERTWTEAGLEPLAPLPGASHRARSFDRLIDAVAAYALNLNSHPAYAAFRRARARLRDAGAAPDGAVLARYLTRYSERGAAYVAAVRGLIRHNRLQALDGAVLRDDRA